MDEPYDVDADLAKMHEAVEGFVKENPEFVGMIGAARPRRPRRPRCTVLTREGFGEIHMHGTKHQVDEFLYVDGDDTFRMDPDEVDWEEFAACPDRFAARDWLAAHGIEPS
jgi:hypothetical protein